MKPSILAGIFGAVVLLILLFSSIYRVGEWEQAIITQFGKPIGDPEVNAGIHFKKPFVQKVNIIEKRVLEWDGQATEMPTRDKLFISVDTFARWRITDSSRYFIRLRDERSAISRLNDILGGETRTAVADHNLVEIIRSTKEDREIDPELESSTNRGTVTGLAVIETGRPAIEKSIRDAAAPKLAEFGIELLDIRFKRINYSSKVQNSIFTRMISERQKIAERFRSEGAGDASRKLGEMEREVNRIQSEAYRKVQSISGEADAKATSIFAAAYDRSPETREFYRFLKSMETYETSLGNDTTVLLSTDSPLLQFLQSETGNANPSATAPEPAP